MPSSSDAQHRFMAMAMNNPAFAAQRGIKPSVAAEFVHADKGKPWERRDDGGQVDSQAATYAHLTPMQQAIARQIAQSNGLMSKQGIPSEGSVDSAHNVGPPEGTQNLLGDFRPHYKGSDLVDRAFRDEPSGGLYGDLDRDPHDDTENRKQGAVSGFHYGEPTVIGIARGGVAHRDMGGAMPSVGGVMPQVGDAPAQSTVSPMNQNMIQQMQQMPPEKLQEYAARAGASPMGQLAQKILMQKRMMPSASGQAAPVAASGLNPSATSNGLVPQQSAGVGTMARGGVLHRAMGGPMPMGMGQQPMTAQQRQAMLQAAAQPRPQMPSQAPGGFGPVMGGYPNQPPMGMPPNPSASTMPNPVGGTPPAQPPQGQPPQGGNQQQMMSQIMQRMGSADPAHLSQLAAQYPNSPIGMMAGRALSMRNGTGGGSGAAGPAMTPQVPGGSPTMPNPMMPMGATPAPAPAPAPAPGSLGPVMGGYNNTPGAPVQAAQVPGAQTAMKAGGHIKRDVGGVPNSAANPWWERSEARSDGGYGLLQSPLGAVGGRQDTLPHSVAADSYVVPADVVSGLGEGDTYSGSKIMDMILHSMPYGVTPPRGGARPNIPPPPRIQEQAKGGTTRPLVSGPKGKVPVLLANGEYLISPDIVARLGGGDVKRGHRLLDRFVLKAREKTIGELKKLPPPVK